MSIVIDDPHIEALARRLAAIEGMSIEQAVQFGLETAAARIGLTSERSLEDELSSLRIWARGRIQRQAHDTATIDQT